MSERCEMGCVAFHGGEKRHDVNCVFYPGSITEMHDTLTRELLAYKEAYEILERMGEHYADVKSWFQSDKAEGYGIDYQETYAWSNCNGFDIASAALASAKSILKGEGV